MATSNDTIIDEVVLYSKTDWPRWINYIKNRTTENKIWKYLDPDLLFTSEKPPEPI